jgi:hypothetical protein
LDTYTFGDTTFSISGSLEDIINTLFSVHIIGTLQSKEIVSGQYWENVSRKTKTLTPFIFDFPSGAHLTLFSPGDGYSVGDILTVNGSSGYGTVQVLSVGSVFGGGTGILSYTQLSATFTENETALPASGGSGSGAGFNVWVIP